jgi:hypothetical protein
VQNCRLVARDRPAVCVDARQAHAVLSQMPNKTDANDTAMLAELAHGDSTGGLTCLMFKHHQPLAGDGSSKSGLLPVDCADKGFDTLQQSVLNGMG